MPEKLNWRAHSKVISGLLIEYAIAQESGADTLIFLHGFRSDKRGLEPLMKKLERHRMVAVDMPGYGRSDAVKGNKTLLETAAALACFIDELGDKRVVLIGHSLGATIALLVAGIYSPKSVRKLILITPITYYNGFMMSFGRLLFRIPQLLPPGYRDGFMRSSIIVQLNDYLVIRSKDKSIRSRIIMNDLKNSHRLHADVVINTSYSYESTNFRKAMRGVKLPTLIIAAGQDIVAMPSTIAKLAESIKFSSLHTFANAGHLLPVEDASEVAEVIDDWLGMF